MGAGPRPAAVLSLAGIGYPALVHPRTGVIFALASGTIGIVVRLPPDLRAQCPDTEHWGHDIAPAGEAWRFVPSANEEVLCRADFEAAGDGQTGGGGAMKA